MWHIDHWIFGHAPDACRGLARVDKMVSTNSSCGDPSAVAMDTVVHTARAARASISHPDEHQVASVTKRLNHLSRNRFRGRGFAMTHNIGKTVLRVQKRHEGV
ncbi:hypothetical protein NKDENANG_00905 [Candidatus Entotheonellaceae bacterium PAL068K]